MKDYFDEAPTFSNPEIFKRRFRMSKRLFLRIVDDLETNYNYFKQKRMRKGHLDLPVLKSVRRRYEPLLMETQPTLTTSI
ncbi:hypothetical protein Hdeb2414_s0005g00183661 [Helianthus debilis subsp. tardiflorus]